MKRILLIALGASSLAFGQDKAPAKHVRFIPLGELPTWAEDLKDGIRQQRKSPPGSVPPSMVTYAQGEDLKNLRFTLRSFSDMATFPGTAGGILLKEGKGAAGKNFLKTGMPAAPLSLAVLFRDNATMTWENPKLLMLKDDSKSFPAGQMRFVNVSDSTVVVQIAGSAPFGIAPGKTSLKPVSVGKNAINVGYVTANGGKKSIWKNNVPVLTGQRVQCFFYKAQGENPRDAVKFHFAPESVPAIPKQ